VSHPVPRVPEPATPPHTRWSTHDVTNQVPPLSGDDLFSGDLALQEGLAREGAAWAEGRLRAFGARLGSEEVRQWGRDANRHGPELVTFDRTGHRVDEVRFHPAYHQLFTLAKAHDVHGIAWHADDAPTPSAGRPGGHVAHAALEYQLAQIEAGVCCPITMTYAAVPTLRHEPALAETWVPRLLGRDYDPRLLEPGAKASCSVGMAMTEKQGGSDVRANTTVATDNLDGTWSLTGHKWFCSAPMSDAFLVLGRAPAGITCFLVPRVLPDGRRNRFFIQRLKDKLGNRSNASSEIELSDTIGWRVGEPGRGIRTILEMVHHTRLDTTLSAAALGRQALVQAIHHARHRSAFGGLLADKPLMQNVLADLALEVEAQTALFLRLASATDAGAHDPAAAAFARIGIAIGKYWTNKRCPTLVGEAMECLGGAGYVEEHDLPRLYREAPLNGIWEGSGNVICLDVLRAMSREPESVDALRTELGRAAGANAHLDAHLARLDRELADRDHLEARARRIVEALGLALQASLLVQHSPSFVADAFCDSRLGGDWGHAFGTLPPRANVPAILGRALPA
jgi:putative acyl-CoA dehydrogenase